MNFINQSAFLKALGWSLLDSLWQMGLMWLVYVCLTANGKKFQARQRHTIALLSLAGGMVWFLVTLIMNFYAAATGPEVVTVLAGAKGFIESNPGWLAQTATFLDPVLPFLSVAYLSVAGFLFLRFYRHYRHIGQLYTKGISKVHPEWRVFLQQAMAHMGIKKKVSIWFSALADTPLTLGFWKPVILLPIAAVNHLSLQQAEAIILHELNHIRRNDYLVNLLIACADIILFFNPFARLLTGYIRKERENSCDDLVLQFRYDAASYARALLSLEQQRGTASSMLTVAATGKNHQFLLNRIKRILTRENVTTPIGQRLIAYCLSALLIGFIGFYNPGKVIVQTIEERPLSLVNTEFSSPFDTPDLIAGTEKEEVTGYHDEAERSEPDPAAPESPEEQQEADAELAQVEKLETIIELATDLKLAAIAEYIEEMEVELAGFANAWQTIEFSLPLVSPAPNASAKSGESYPFIPNNSFLYEVLEDTTLPKKYIMTESELKAKEAMEKALLALQVIDWKKLEKELQLETKIDISQLQHQIEQAIKDVDWKKIDAETQAALERENVQHLHEQFRVKLGNYYQQRALQLEKIKQAQQQILLDRLEQHEILRKSEADKVKQNCNTTTKKKKKIIHI